MRWGFDVQAGETRGTSNNESMILRIREKWNDTEGFMNVAFTYEVARTKVNWSSQCQMSENADDIVIYMTTISQNSANPDAFLRSPVNSHRYPHIAEPDSAGLTPNLFFCSYTQQISS